ncbi:MAG: hypothetical protein FVQ83_10785 [Chloroflexi bacterium]|nr:hypothetical protein [Chloroflexota bacterium]
MKLADKFRAKKVLILLAIFGSLTIGCSNLNVPEAVARSAFENFVLSRGWPHRDEKFETVSNDGTFATVKITTFFRFQADEHWQEQEALLECWKVGSQWQCDAILYFELSQREQQIVQAQQAQQDATATAQVVNRVEILAEVELNNYTGGMKLELADIGNVVIADIIATAGPTWPFFLDDQGILITEKVYRIFITDPPAYAPKEWMEYQLGVVISDEAYFAIANGDVELMLGIFEQAGLNPNIIEFYQWVASQEGQRGEGEGFQEYRNRILNKGREMRMPDLTEPPQP